MHSGGRKKTQTTGRIYNLRWRGFLEQERQKYKLQRLINKSHRQSIKKIRFCNTYKQRISIQTIHKKLQVSEKNGKPKRKMSKGYEQSFQRKFKWSLRKRGLPHM